MLNQTYDHRFEHAPEGVLHHTVSRFLTHALAFVLAAGFTIGVATHAGATEPNPALQSPSAETGTQASPPGASTLAPQTERAAPEATTPEATAPAGRTGAETAQGQSGNEPANGENTGLVGLPVMTVDGREVGSVDQVVTAPDGTTREIVIKTGGFFGFGARRVAIPVDKVTTGGNVVRLALSESELESLPDARPSQS